MKFDRILPLIAAVSACLVAGCDSKAPEAEAKPPSAQKPVPSPTPTQVPTSQVPTTAPIGQPQNAGAAIKPAVAEPRAKVSATPTPPEAPKQGTKPRPNLEKTKQLFESISSKRPGEKFGKVEWRDGAGILLHPGSTPTEVVFDLAKMKGNANLVFWICGLPVQVLGNPKSGTAGVTVEIDGIKDGRKLEIKMPRKEVDRFTNATIPVSFSGAKTMRVIVDDADGTQLCDWFFMGVE